MCMCNVLHCCNTNDNGIGLSPAKSLRFVDTVKNLAWRVEPAAVHAGGAPGGGPLLTQAFAALDGGERTSQNFVSVVR